MWLVVEEKTKANPAFDFFLTSLETISSIEVLLNGEGLQQGLYKLRGKNVGWRNICRVLSDFAGEVGVKTGRMAGLVLAGRAYTSWGCGRREG
ncbi:hypothetical protein Tco_0521770 [Tanacetum coccineum]